MARKTGKAVRREARREDSFVGYDDLFHNDIYLFNGVRYSKFQTSFRYYWRLPANAQRQKIYRRPAMSSETPEQLREYLERLPLWARPRLAPNHSAQCFDSSNLFQMIRLLPNKKIYKTYEADEFAMILLGHCVQLLAERGYSITTHPTRFGSPHLYACELIGYSTPLFQTPLAAAVAALAGMGEKA